jgi:outer membrane protein insertion porin family
MIQSPLQNSASTIDQPDNGDLQRILEWHTKRRERILRGEYESQMHRLSELVGSIFFLEIELLIALAKVNQNLDTPMRIAAVRVEGATNTRQTFLASLVNPFLVKPANTLGDVLHTTRHISQLFHKANLFKTIETRLERSEDLLSSPNDVDIVFKMREFGRYYLNTSTELGNNEGTAVCVYDYHALPFHIAPSQQLPE